MTGYSLTVFRGQADYRPDIHSSDTEVRLVANRILSDCMQGSGQYNPIITTRRYQSIHSQVEYLK
jgi:hypothetical protein